MPTLISIALLAVPLQAPPEAPPPAAVVGELVRRGREALRSGDLAEARVRLTRALELGGGEHDVRTWILRLEIAEGRCEEVLRQAEQLDDGGGAATDSEYLMGLASFGLASAAIDAGRADGSTAALLVDGQHFLARALASDPERYSDAWPILADAAWRNGALDAADEAVRTAVEHEPDDATLQALRGRIAFARYQGFRDAGDGADTALLEAEWSNARGAFERCIMLLGRPSDGARQRALAEAEMALGNLHAWKADDAAAAAAYARAMAQDPASVDFARIQGALPIADFAAATEAAVQRFYEIQAQADTRLATLLWWDGWSHWRTESFERAATAFRSAVELWPAYTNSWYWIHRAESARGEYAAAITALRSFQSADRAGLLRLLAQDPASEVPRLEWLVGWSVDPGRSGGRARNTDAAFLCQLLTELAPEVSRHWNNLGLFLRDEGDVLRYAGGADPAALANLWDRALAAYERALALEPANPNYLNDTAVMLHYYAKRDLDRARELYLEATRVAEAELARPDLASELRDVLSIALRDSRDNVRKLDAWRERIAAGESWLDPKRLP